MNTPCPLLPEIGARLTAADARAVNPAAAGGAYLFRLRYAQSKWGEGLPAQALLQLNRALAVPLQGGEAELTEFPLPYGAVAWILSERPDRRGQFLANPRRHWQHYATRMAGPMAELRTWRAWACHAIAARVLPEAEFPADADQIAGEGLTIPGEEEVEAQLVALGLPGEAELWRAALAR